MMRWLLALLVLANAGLFMWGSWYKDADLPSQPRVRADINPEQMRLIPDPKVKLTPRRANRPPAVKTLQPIKRVCHEVGVFTSTKEAVRAGALLKKSGLEYSLRTKETVERRYQVYVPPRESAASAKAMQQKLTKLGFRDNFLMPQKGFKNAISVGIFNKRDNAIKLQRNLKRKGVSSKRRLITRKRSQFWLDVPTDPENLAALKAIRWQTRGVLLKETTCVNAPTAKADVKSK
jgi:cell division protein FtsN